MSHSDIPSALPKGLDQPLSNSHIYAIGWFATAYSVHTVKSGIDLNAQRAFDFDCMEIQLKVEGRLQTHKQVLLGGAALFDASKVLIVIPGKSTLISCKSTSTSAEFRDLVFPC